MFGYQCRECRKGTVEPRVVKDYRTKVAGVPFTVDHAVIGYCNVCESPHFSPQERRRWEREFLQQRELPFKRPVRLAGGVLTDAAGRKLEAKEIMAALNGEYDALLHERRVDLLERFWSAYKNRVMAEKECWTNPTPEAIQEHERARLLLEEVASELRLWEAGSD